MATSEAQRQSALLRLLWAEGTADAPKATDADLLAAGLQPATLPGLAAHRRHARASARHCLIASHPTVAAMLGEEAMAMLAVALWQAHPPTQGDLGEWGGALAELLQSRDELAPWPWLADTARLDWARQRCARTAAHPVDVPSLQRLADTSPDAVRLVLQPHVMLCHAPWPLHGLWQAHQGPPAQHARAAEAALAAHAGERHAVLLWWGGPVDADAPPGVQQQPLPEAEADWVSSLMQPHQSLDAALQQAHPDFDFSAWLAQALRQGWVQGAQALTPAGT